MTKTPAPFAARLVRAPRAHDPERGAESWAALGPDLALPELRPLIEGAAGSSPYLRDLMAKEAAWLPEALAGPPETALAGILADAAAAVAEPRTLGGALRRGKRRLALLTGLADLGGVWDLEAVTGALSDYADAAVEAAIRAGLADEIARGRLPGAEADPTGTSGLVSIAMGKGGARELNYSSDIDLIFLFDESRHDPADHAEIRARLVKVCQGAAQLLSKPTGEGYVFRTDLRLRPDPSVTPVCISMDAAESYYESLGRTWERAAFIKARAASGDIAAGEGFLDRLRPFIWRRFLDFAAIRDAHDIRERNRAHRGVGGEISVPGHDVKLGRGGIREIEFFVQTRQLICGGRDPALRPRATREGLAALVGAGWVAEETAAVLDAAYLAHRELEHRLQMVEDRQTHAMPTAPEASDRIAALAGFPDRESLETALDARLRAVAAITETFFAPAASRKAQPDPAAGAGTGTGGDARTDPLTARGFARAETGMALVDRWRQGTIPATRSDRARGLLAELEPLMLDALARAASPDDALIQFDRFLSGLPAGVQILSLFSANPRLLDLIAEICAAAPRLAEELGRNSRVIDAILATDFFRPLPDADALTEELEGWLAREGDDYERKLDAARAWAKEMRFRMGVQLLRGIADAEEAGQGFAAIAEAALRALMPEVEAEFARRYGPAPGAQAGGGAAVLAMGRLGSREMTANSDLDLILLYDAAGAEASEGPKPLATAVWYSRFAQALILAMTAKTAEGALYEIDMRLRPSGRQGTVATSVDGFRAYHAEQAWTWERMALTRARAVAGRPGPMAKAGAAIDEALARPRPPGVTRADAAEMRARVAEAARGGRSEPWSVKRTWGGLMDVEFAAQAGLLARIDAAAEAGEDPAAACA
ncbi:MAG: bifunctional [glutamine synthetase] adenylyltransferase/[glutamine synthetase]-adenylyl-L-tyrosine phosphorylase, partial [Pseudomonadota bacterium]|nr:bifunctional [glutamine synthetase] adenylyltransferase/[glutamine synthetase]-adenylyl-L-tyrosine phosphorylase [Pseudomonadota bacterium]